jgi:dynactin-4
MPLSLHYLKRVLYSCSCSQPAPLTDLYFCRHCKVARCQDCVSITVDTYFCPHCFETAPISEAKNKKNRCNHCFQCPRCASTLTTRSIIVPSEVLAEQSPKKTEQTSPSPSAKAASLSRSPGGTKSYYLSCTHCRWSTRDVGIKDKRSPIDFKDPPSRHCDRISKLVAFYKDFSLRDQAEREKARKVGRRGRNYGGLLDPSKFMKSSPSSSPTPLRRATPGPFDQSTIDRMAAQSTDCPDPVPDDFYSSELNLNKIPTLLQRLLDPTHQPDRVEEFTPRPLHLIGKRLLRCNGCDHILLKAEINPSSIRFKIQQIALHTFPQVRIFEPPKLVPNESCEVLLSVSNPLSNVVSVSFDQLSPVSVERSKESLVPVSLPAGSYQLNPNDDMGDLLDEPESELEGEKEFIHSRHLGKLVLKFSVTPAATPDQVKIGFVMTLNYRPAVEPERQDAAVPVPIPIIVDLGKILPSED